MNIELKYKFLFNGLILAIAFSVIDYAFDRTGTVDAIAILIIAFVFTWSDHEKSKDK